MIVPMRRINRQLSENEALLILQHGEYGFLSTISVDNTPYVTPLNYVYYDGAIYFHCATSGHKLDNIKNNNSVCFSVVSNAKVLAQQLTTEYKSVMVFGTAEILLSDDTMEPLMKLINKYSSDYLDEGKASMKKYHGKTAVIKVSINHITGKENRG